MREHDGPRTHELARGERAIAIYKGVKGVLQLVLAVLLLGVLAVDGGTWLEAAAADLRTHAMRAWSVWFVRLLEEGARPRRVAMTAAALALDGVLTSVEGWALRRRASWGPWLVVVTTSSLLPFELFAFVRHAHHHGAAAHPGDLPSAKWAELAGFVLNAIIVVYLARRAMREQRRLARRAPSAG